MYTKEQSKLKKSMYLTKIPGQIYGFPVKFIVHPVFSQYLGIDQSLQM